MYSGTRVILATVTPKAGALERVIELYQVIIQYAEANEPGCIEFQLFTEVNAQGKEELFTIERFKNFEVLRTHQEGPALVEFNRKVDEEKLLEKPIMIKVVKGVSGYYI
ncbi:hypothetical protein F5884DRAFT_812782 [Xylogone sp. PMI_703]|nr:hypothetical protein F5884DRAFT_812782 [Xylogone sp. PMI_703]